MKPLTKMASTSVPLTISPPPSPAAQSRPNPSPAVSLPKPKPQTIRFRLSKLCQEGQPHLARQLFDALPRPTTVLWNTVIIGFVCNNFPEEALTLYARMKTSSPAATRCDPYTYSSTLKACADSRQLSLGRAVHCHVIRCSRTPSAIVHNSLLNMYAACCSPGSDLVRKVFASMPKRNVVAWNTLVAWHARNEEYSEAISGFARMMSAGVKPSPVSFVNVFPALSGLGDFGLAEALYGLIVKMGGEYLRDSFVVSAAIFTFSELGLVDFSRKVFDSSPVKNTEIWNTMIGCYVQNNLPLEAVDLFLEAVNSGETGLDEVTLLSALAAVSQLQRLDLARELHCFAVRNSGPPVPIAIGNSIVAMYSRCGSVETSFRAFDQMPVRDLVSWNTMVTALVHSGSDSEAVMIVREMMKEGIRIDHVTVSALLSAASNLRDSGIGKQTHGYLIRREIAFEGMDSYLCDMYSKSGRVEALRTIFSRGSYRDRDLATWNSIVAGFTQNGLADEALAVFRRLLRDRNPAPNSVTVASVLPACCQLSNAGLGKELHGFSIRRSLDRNVFVGSALVDMYSKSGGISSAGNVFRRAAERNSVTFTNMILGYGQHGMGPEALALFRSMRDYGVAPDAVTFIAILSACSYCGLVEQGLEIFESMKRDHNIRPLIAHYCCVTDMLGRVGRVSEAYEFVLGLGEEGDAVEIWGSVLGACRVHEEFELGKIVAERLVGSGSRNGDEAIGYRVLVSNMLAEEGEWERVYGLRREMREKGLRKETGRSWIETCGSVSHFVSRDQRHFRSHEIYDMLGRLADEMRASRVSDE